eukprot:764653-Prymnesium_polylepis.1
MFVCCAPRKVVRVAVWALELRPRASSRPHWGAGRNGRFAIAETSQSVRDCRDQSGFRTFTESPT